MQRSKPATVAVWASRTTVALVVLGLAAAGAAAEPGSNHIRDNLYATKFIDLQYGWAVGAFGTIARTADGGQTWQPQASRTTEPLFGVDFVDQRHGWVVGRSGLILHTGDGGETWAPQRSGVKTDKHLFGVDFVDARFGCAVGDWGTILMTRDGGQTWEPRSLTHDVILNDVALLDRSRGWIVGEMGTVLATDDGGQTWTARGDGIGKTLFGVYFADGRRGWAVGIDALILHTEDGGVTWRVQNGSLETGALEQVGFSQTYDNPSLYAVTVAGKKGFVVGEIGTIFTSTDGGQTWARQPVPAEWGVSWLRDVSVVAGTHGMIVGAEGRRVPIAGGRVELPRERDDAAEALD